MQVNKYPRTASEFIDSKWYSKVQTAIRSFRLREHEDDVLQDILVALIEKDYLARFDNTKGSFSTWLYGFVNNLLRRKYNRSHTKGGMAIEGAVSFSKFSDDDSFSPLQIEDASALLSDRDIIVQECIKILSDDEFKAYSSYTGDDGITYPRDMKTVFQFLVKEDLSVKEMANRFNTSQQFVYSLIRKMRPILSEALGRTDPAEV